MEKNENKHPSKNIFKTPKITNKKISLKKTKSSGNLLNKSSESFSKLKTPFIENKQKNKNNNICIPKKNSSKNFNDLNNKPKIEKEKLKIKLDKNKNADKNTLNQKKIISKSLNIIPLPFKKNITSNKMLNKTLEKNDRYSPRIIKKNKSFSNKNSDFHEKEKKEKKNISKNGEKINKNLLKHKKEPDIIPIAINKIDTIKNINSDRLKTRSKKFEFLYMPHIILDPLDVLNNQIEIILQKYEEKIKLLNKSNCITNINYIIKSTIEKYTKDLFDLYQEKENELNMIKNNYNKQMYNLNYNNENINEDEINKNKETQIKDLEEKFKEKKEKLKNDFKNKIEDIKKSYNKKEQIDLNKKFCMEMKNKFLKIFNDKNMINKKGINFSLKDYKNSLKHSLIKSGKLRSSSFEKNKFS